MNTRNTITRPDYRKISQVQALLEVICDESSMLIIESLRLHGISSLSDLIVQTGIEKFLLEEQMHLLVDQGIVQELEELSGAVFVLDEIYLARIAGFANRVGAFGPGYEVEVIS